MAMIVAYVHQTRWGRFAIIARPNGRWSVMFEDEDLGSYHSPIAAHDDLIGGHCSSNSADLDTSEIGLPYELADWQRVLARR